MLSAYNYCSYSKHALNNMWVLLILIQMSLLCYSFKPFYEKIFMTSNYRNEIWKPCSRCQTCCKRWKWHVSHACYELSEGATIHFCDSPTLHRGTDMKLKLKKFDEMVCWGTKVQPLALGVVNAITNIDVAALEDVQDRKQLAVVPRCVLNELRQNAG